MTLYRQARDIMKRTEEVVAPIKAS